MLHDAHHPPRLPRAFTLALTAVAAIAAGAGSLEAQAPVCPAGGSTTTAKVVALDQPFYYNRLGAINLHGMIYALRRDVVNSTTGLTESEGGQLIAGQVMLRPDRRPRPLTLRVNEGDCLRIEFQNLLAPVRPWEDQPAMRTASVHVMGLAPVGSIISDGSNVGRNAGLEAGPSGNNGVVAPGGSAVYTLLAETEGAYLLHSGAPQVGGEANGSGLAFGLFGQVNVEPPRSEWYRSQLTREEMALATRTTTDEWGVETPVTTPGGQPVLDYEATYPTTHPRSGGVAGIPIIKMTTASGEIVHADINAVITGPNRGRLDAGLGSCDEVYPENVILEDRCEPFREFTVIFHDEVKAIQAFNDVFTDPVLKHTLHSTRDAFAMNYGTGGIGAEILSNRLGLGPMWNCNECKYEEFFLTSWAVGDPAMLVDEPAALDPTITGPKATKALYPDDPSNVFHSYLNDHVKIRNTHAGPKEHHIFHLHGHQWVNTPNDDNSAYLDSQLIGPGSGFTYDIAYGGSGNRNKTPGDAIFHCHFYPHFAQGMWSLWRVHDVFEAGTVLNADGTVATDIPDWQARALPDGEIAAGVPVPAVVPLPGKAMAPVPTAALPGYPFYIPGVAGHRPPQPPMDFAKDDNGENIDGGLPRHVVIDDGIDFSDGNPRRVAPVTDPASSGIAVAPPLNRLDFSKDNVELNVLNLPGEGTPLEQNAMAFHELHEQPSWSQDGNGGMAASSFLTNGMERSWGAPYAAPCTFGDGKWANGSRNITYKGVGLQIDATYTKDGWHFPQHRMMALNEDVADLRDGTRPPEPFFIRVNSGDCIRYEMTNLLPKEYDLDDFQVQTPTDVMGQHIHLVKFDVTSADGSANGYNYEDGTLSFQEVQERIEAINARGGIITSAAGDRTHLEPEMHPYFGTVAPDLALGAQTTVQQWYADNVMNNAGEDRTLRTVFTHDHFAPSTLQQGGYYAGLIVEPTGSTWRDPETGVALGTRDDGGPTSWRADIITVDPDDSYREFLFEFQDFTLGYYAGSNHTKRLFPTGTGDGLSFEGIADPANAIAPPGRVEIGLPFLLQRPLAAGGCPGGVPAPCPEAVSAEDPGFFSLNYRAEPVPLRVRDPQTNTQAPGVAGDLAHVFRSDVMRADPAANLAPAQWPVQPLTLDVQPGDPITPMMRVYEGDRVQIRTLVGAHEEGHNLSFNGIKWLYEPSMENSGYRASQGMGLSEHFEYVVPALSSVKGGVPFEDYLFMPSSGVDAVWSGTWAIMRAYDDLRTGATDQLLPLPSNPDGKAPRMANSREFRGVCPRNAPERKWSVAAVLARDALPGGTLMYNSRGGIHDPTAILYVDARDVEKSTGQLKPGVPVEPLVLRANAGDCINVTLENHLPAGVLPDHAGFSTVPPIVDDFQLNQVAHSSDVGLHPQLLTYDMFTSDGNNAGFNPVQTAAPGGVIKYRWYAGDVVACTEYLDDPRCFNADGSRVPTGTRVATPVEFGATGLIPADRIKGSQKGAIGSLIVEPRCAEWTTDPGTRTAATVSVYPEAADGTCSYGAEPTETFREFSLVYQNDLNLRCDGCGDADDGDIDAIPNLAEAEDPEDSGQKAINYRTEPFWQRMGHAPDTPLGATRNMDFTDAVANAQVGGDPETPVFTAEVGTPVRFRLVQAGGHQRNGVFTVYGHSWQQLPYMDGSTRIGDNPLSEVRASAEGIGATSHFNILLEKAGGEGGVVGDYLYRDMPTFTFDGGMWGLLRVCPTGTGGNNGNTQCLPDGS